MADLIFVHKYFFPDYSASSQLLSDLVFDLADRGYRITVITSRQHYDHSEVILPPREAIRNVRIIRVWSSRFGRHRLMGRMLDYISFYGPVTWAMFRFAKSGSILVSKTEPPMITVAAAFIARLRKARLINWIQDVFPEVAAACGVPFMRGPLYTTLRSLRNWSMKKADVNVVLGKSMAEVFEAQGVPRDRLTTIPNWANGTQITPMETDKIALRREWGLQGKFVVGYSGNLGRVHDAVSIRDAALALRDDGQICFLVIGGGAGNAWLRQEVVSNGLGNVVFKPYQLRENLGQSLGAADIHIVSQRPETEGLVLPSKLYGVLAAGRPVLFIGDRDAEISCIVREEGCGRIIESGNGAQLADCIRTLATDPEAIRTMGLRARVLFEARYDSCRTLEDWRHVVDTVSGVDPDHVMERSG